MGIVNVMVYDVQYASNTVSYTRLSCSTASSLLRLHITGGCAVQQHITPSRQRWIDSPVLYYEVMSIAVADHAVDVSSLNRANTLLPLWKTVEKRPACGR